MEEYWDVLDGSRRPTGRTVRKGEPLAEGECHLLVAVYTFSPEGELLTTLRDSKKYYWPGMWECTGGSALAGEDSETAARRELLEETGLCEVELHFLGSGQMEMCYIDCYLAVAPKQELTLQEQEVAGYRWVKEEEYRALCRAGSFVPVVEADLNRFWGKIQEILAQYRLGKM